MIKEIKLYKSIEDYCKSDLHYDWPVVDDVSYTSVWIVSVCPYCGQEQIIRWDWCKEWPCFRHMHRARYINDPAEKEKVEKEEAEKSKQEARNKELISKKIIDDIDDYLSNHFVCCTCSKDLVAKPGYFYCSMSHYGDLRYRLNDDDKLPLGFVLGKDDHELMYFDGYTEDSLYKKYAYTAEGNRTFKYDYSFHEIQDLVYNMNAISTEYFEKNITSFSNDISKPDDETLTSLYILKKDGSPVEKYLSVEQTLRMLKFYREYEGLYAGQVTSLIKTEKRRLENSLEVEPVKQDLSSDTIKTILKEVIGFETSLLSLEKRLNSLYLIKERENSKYLGISTKKEESAIVQLKERIEELTQERSSLENESLDINLYVDKVAADKPKISYPTEPNMPVEPAYEKPGLFNKKKVEASNSELKQLYEAKLTKYKTDIEVYRNLLSEAQQMEKEQNEEIRQEAFTVAQEDRQKKMDTIDSQVKDCETKIETAKSELSRKEKEIQAAKENLSELPWNKEYDLAVDLLKKTLEAKIMYEKSEVIFPKYQNLVAYSQFYEYFQAGRCTSLTGPDGAYNLYETELRQNIIIGKLDDISNSLEEIKQNQYMIYSELKSINSNISMLNNSMRKILGKVTEIGTNVEAIKSNTEIIEQNTRISAYYSKKNAELTNAMGYLVALK